MSTRTAEAIQTAFHERIGARNLAALWVARRGMDLTRPKSPARPALWRYADIRPDIMTAGDIVTAEDAFRRVLVLENPAFAGEMRVTNTLYAGLQLVLPGETAPCHRHSQTALRFIVEGSGAFTSVDGERIALAPGDFVITPQWAWHDHVNEGDEPVVWLDVLDTPLVDFFDTVFRETYPEMTFPETRPEGDSPARFGAGLLPDGWVPAHPASPALSYPYARIRAALATLAARGEWDACHGIRMRYANPANGGPPTPTLGVHIELLPAGFRGAEYRSTDATVYLALEGQGITVVDGTIYEWGPRDIVVVPGWHRHHHVAESEAVLFAISDRAAQQALGLWREERFDGR